MISLLLSALLFSPVRPTESIHEALVIGGVSKGGRFAIQQDLVQNQLNQGSFTPPKEGDTLGKSAWKKLTANKDNVFEDDALSGGWAYVPYESTDKKILVLEAAGQGTSIINGTPRVGDPYSNGYVRVPIALNAGHNDLLFSVGRGRLTVNLIPPRASQMINPGDPTLPDIVAGANERQLGAVVLMNATEDEVRGLKLVAKVGDGVAMTSNVPLLGPLMVRKVGFEFRPSGKEKGDKMTLNVSLMRGTTKLDEQSFDLRIRTPKQARKVTFHSDIDGSVQYYAVNPSQMPAEGQALVLSLHGASVEAIGQAEAYAGKNWANIVCPTNRRPYGFDWEEWGRWDALEVLGQAQKSLRTAPARTYLTGHSMGGHGTWQVGVSCPELFAAIAPSAGWSSFFAYGGSPRITPSHPVEEIMGRSTNPSDTIPLLTNLTGKPIYILHGDKDDNVPVSEARLMRDSLLKIGIEPQYHEEPGAGHWWGSPCVDWPPIFDMFQRTTLSDKSDIDFSTVNPSISATAGYATILQQETPLKASRIQLKRTEKKIAGMTQNVERLQLRGVEGFDLVLDGTTLGPIKTATVDLERFRSGWRIAAPMSPIEKNPSRNGPFKEAFRRRMIFVYGAHGTKEENLWCYTRARFDAETFWYRGNGSVDIVPDTEYLRAADRDYFGRNVILYGNADINTAWASLLATSPIQVRRTSITQGDHKLEADDLFSLQVRPLPNDPGGLVAAIGGTGFKGLKSTERLPYFLSGTGYPDWIVGKSTIWTEGLNGVLGAGFFGNDWTYYRYQSAWR